MAEWSDLDEAEADLFGAVCLPDVDDCLAAIHAALEAGADVNARGLNCTPLHNAVWKNPNAAAVSAAVQLLVAAGADVRAKANGGDEPLHAAAYNSFAAAAAAALQALVAAGADVRAKGDDGAEPLHSAAVNKNAKAAAAAIRVLLAAGADSQAKQVDGETPLVSALYHPHSPARVQAAALLATASPTQAVLEDLCSAPTDIAWELLPDFIASRLPLTEAQWVLIPVDRPGLGRILPAALASSVAQAGQVVRRLPPPDAQRLRTFALCLARLQRRIPISRRRRAAFWSEYLPASAVQRILSFFDALI